MDFIQKVKSIPITDYAASLGFEVVRKSRRYCSLREHDSVMIDVEQNCFWQNSVFVKGRKGGAGSIIDFALAFDDKYRNKTLSEVARGLAKQYCTDDYIPRIYSPKTKTQKNVLSETELPDSANDDRKVFSYLVGVRCISPIVYHYLSKRGMVYQDSHNNAVFVSWKDNKPVFACLRSTDGNRFMLDCVGCNYDECFFIKGESDTVVVVESVIEALSYMSMLVENGQKFLKYSYLSLAGTNKMMSLYYHLKKGDAQYVILALNNDKGGIKSTNQAIDELLNMGYNGRFKTDYPSDSDWNDVLKAFRSVQNKN